MNMLPMLQQLHWLPVEFRIDFKMLMLTYKALNNQVPDYISELLTFYKRSFALISFCQMHHAVPKTKTKLYGDSKNYNDFIVFFGDIVTSYNRQIKFV